MSLGATDRMRVRTSSLCRGLLGAVTGYSALRRRGLFLALTTLAVGLVAYRFVFESTFFANRVIIDRPVLFFT